MAQHWKYTLDTNYAAKVYLFLKEVANFWDNYLVYTNGVYIDYNDSVAEQTGNDTQPATTVAFLQLLYPTVIQMSQALNVDAGSRPLWGNIITNLYPISIVPASSIGSIYNLGAPYDSSGVNVIQDSLAGTQFPTPEVTAYQDHQIRGSSPGMNSTQVIFPGWLVGLESPASTIKAATNTIWIAAEWLDGNDDCTFYPSAASVGYDPNAILSNLDILIDYYRYNNFMFNTEGGGTEDFAIIPCTLAAMFVQSYQTNMHVFPDWSTNQSAAFGNLNACGGFLVSSAITLGKPNYIQIQSTAGQTLKLVNPWSNSTVQCVSSIHGATNLSGSILNYQTQAGEVLTLTTTNATLSAPTNATVSTNGNSIVLNWNPVSGAAGYNVKRSTSPNGPFTDFASVTSGTSYTDASVGYSTTYYYEITALEPGYESTNSSVLTATSAPKPPILNASFESQSVSHGSYLIGDPTGWSSSLLPGTADAVISPGASGTGEPWPTIPVPGVDGTNYCQIYATAAGGGGLVYQDTGLKYVPGATYSLTAAFGLQTYQSFDVGSSFGLYNSGLVPVASATITSNNLVSGSFEDTTLTYTGTGNEGGNGDIIICFYAPPAAASGTYLDFDNVRLVVSNPAPPTITTQPLSKTTNAGGSVTFTVVAAGTSPLSYQWYANTNTPVTGATNAALTLSNVVSSATYDVVVSNLAGSITSSIVNLTVSQSTNPVSIPIANNTFSEQSVSSGSYLNLQTVGPTGWSASGVSSAVVALVNPSTTDGRGFTNIPVPGLNGANYCQIYAYQGGGTGIVYQDTGIKYVAGVTYNFTAAFGLENSPFPTGASMGFYNSNLTPVASQTINSNNLTLGTFTSQTLGYTATGSEGGNGDIIIGFKLPGTSGAASFDFGNVSLTQASAAAPGISIQPVSQAVYTGQSTSFSVSAYGSTPLAYQWQAGPAGGPYTNLVNGGQISGVNSNILILSNPSTNEALAYQVVITNAYGSVTSTPTATLSILPGTLLSISNAGFDIDTITGANAPGYQIVTPTGWTVSGTNSSSYIGLINPLSLGVYTSTNGYSVPNALESFSGDGVANPTVSQVLSSTLQANTTYTVSVQVGNRTSGTWGGYHILLETTNGTLVGDWVGVINYAAPVGNVAATGTFATTARSFTTGSNPPGLGQKLQIVLSQGAPTAGSYNDFDNVSVVATPTTGHTNGTPIDVFISAGQSNDQGAYAFVPDLSQTNLHYANAPDSRALFAYKHAQYNAPTLSWNTGSVGQLSPDGAGHGENLPGFGPELPVGTDLAVRFGKPLVMIKFAAGGADLHTDFLKSDNFLYPEMITEITNSLQQLTAQGYIPTIRGFFWLQGEGDATANPTTYTNDIAQFVSDVRSDLKVPKLEFVLTQINSNMPAFANYQTGVAEVNAAMTTLVSSDTNVKFVTTDDMISGFGDGNIHYSADQIVTVGQRWAVAYSPQIPFITTQPAAMTTNVGSSASFTVAAIGSSTLTYQWYANTNSLIAGATNPTLTLSNVQKSATYNVVVSNSYGSSTSSIVGLTVLPNAPSSPTATPGVNAVTLAYGKVPNAKFYVIYRSKVSGGSYTKVATTTATKYIDRNVIPGTTYYYVVIACDGVNLSSYSSQVSAKPLK
jgi:fibronectin type 3 domain-containing protein